MFFVREILFYSELSIIIHKGQVQFRDKRRWIEGAMTRCDGGSGREGFWSIGEWFYSKSVTLNLQRIVRTPRTLHFPFAISPPSDSTRNVLVSPFFLSFPLISLLSSDNDFFFIPIDLFLEFTSNVKEDIFFGGEKKNSFFC